ncbi:gfo/Idh/MocA family oxidoreductase [Opitutaceae bacterium TAV4]|nr:gfo/Idh/MocA family oxidoreductase [Opitutaceae bacterium TAV4]RRK01844.1 gfo/Idh/MocA family oxidoreductase [Opitutaceae bacterium TAV3]
MQRVKIAQIGVTHEHANGKMKTLRLLPEIFEIAGVVNDLETAKTARFVHRLDPVFDNFTWLTEAGVLNMRGLQAVTVEVPNMELLPVAERCLERGLPMHLDKPPGDDWERFARFRRRCAEKNVPLQMGYMFRGNPAIRFAINAVKQGWLGDVFEVQAGMSHNYGGEPYNDYLAQLRGGIMFNLGCHLIDFVVAMLDEPVAVTPFLNATADVAAATVNNAVAILEYPRALVTLHACSKEVGGLPKRRLKICGTNGTIEIVPIERFDGKPLLLQMTLKDAAGNFPAGDITLNFGVIRDRYETQLREFAALVLRRSENPYSVEHDCITQKVLLAASGILPFH